MLKVVNDNISSRFIIDHLRNELIVLSEPIEEVGVKNIYDFVKKAKSESIVFKSISDLDEEKELIEDIYDFLREQFIKGCSAIYYQLEELRLNLLAMGLTEEQAEQFLNVCQKASQIPGNDFETVYDTLVDLIKVDSLDKIESIFEEKVDCKICGEEVLKSKSLLFRGERVCKKCDDSGILNEVVSADRARGFEF